MIAKLKGILDSIEKGAVVVDVNGVCYSVHVSELDLRKFPKIGDPIVLETHTHVREDALELFGFLSRLDRELFSFLMEANGVGPKLALGVLSNLDGETLLRAIRTSDIRLLTAIPGIGKKKAERLVLELGDKAEKRFAEYAASAKSHAWGVGAVSGKNLHNWTEALLSALVGLGYKEMDARRAIAHVANQKDGFADLEAGLRESLKFLSQSSRTLSGNA